MLNKKLSTLLARGGDIAPRQFSNDPFISAFVPSARVGEVGAGAFQGCKCLEHVDLSFGSHVIGAGAFADCAALRCLKYQSKNTTFADHCFSHDRGLQQVIIDDVAYKVVYLAKDDSFIIANKDLELSDDLLSVYKGSVLEAQDFPQQFLSESDICPIYYVECHGAAEGAWFDMDLDTAVVGAQYTASKLSFADYFHKEITLDDMISWRDFKLLIGLTDAHGLIWSIMCAFFGVDYNSTHTVADILAFLRTYYLPMANTFQSMLNQQHSVCNRLEISTLLSSRNFIRHSNNALAHVVNDLNNKLKAVKG